VLKKIVLSIFIIFLLAYGVFAQTAQTITLKPGFNFISFSASISSTPAQLKTQNPAIEDIYLFSAAAGSFLSATEGTLSTLAAGKGYIIKSSAASDNVINIPGDAVQTIGNINLKTGFNLIGFSKIPATTVSFSSLMNVYSAIKGIYKWSPAAGSFIQVVRDNSGAVKLLDGADPSFKAGESYFFNLTEDTTINYDGSNIILGNGPPAPIAKFIEISGEIGTTIATPYLASINRMIDNTNFQINIFDEINNIPLESAEAFLLGQSTYKVIIPGASGVKYASIIINNIEKKVIYKTFLGRVPNLNEFDENNVKVTNLRIDDNSSAKAIIAISKKDKLPFSAVIARKSVDAQVSLTTFMEETKESFGEITPVLNELVKIIGAIRGVSVKLEIDEFIKNKINETSYDSLKNVIETYVNLLYHYNYLTYTHYIYIPASISFGQSTIKEGASSDSIQNALNEIDKIAARPLLKSIELSKTTDSVLIKTDYDLSSITAMAVYSDGSKKAIIPYWKKQPGSESSGNIWINSSRWAFTPAQDTYEINITAEYTDDNVIFKSSDFRLYVVSTNPPVSLSLSKIKGYTSTYKDLSTGTIYGFYPLSDIKATITLTDGSTKQPFYYWKIISGNGKLAYDSFRPLTYITSGSAENVILQAYYSENNTTVTADFNLIVDERPAPYSDIHREKVTSAGGSITLGDWASGYSPLYYRAKLEIPANAVSDSAEVSFINYECDSSEKAYFNNAFTALQGGDPRESRFFEIRSNAPIHELAVSMPVPSDVTKDNVYIEIFDPNTQKIITVPDECITLTSDTTALQNNSVVNRQIQDKAIQRQNEVTPIMVLKAFITGISLGVIWHSSHYWPRIKVSYSTPYAPKYNKVIMNLPHYPQYNGTCQVTAFNTLLNAYYPNNGFNIPKLLNFLNLDKNAGFDVENAMPKLVNIFSFGYLYKEPSYTDKFLKLIKILDDGIYNYDNDIKTVVVVPFFDKSFGDFKNQILKALDSGLPVIVFGPGNTDQHLYVIYGYIKQDNKIQFFVDSTGLTKIINKTTLTEEDIRTYLWSASRPRMNYIVYKKTPFLGQENIDNTIKINCSKLVTITLPDSGAPCSYSASSSKIEVIKEDDNATDKVIWDHNSPNGYRLNINELNLPSHFDGINFSVVLFRSPQLTTNQKIFRSVSITFPDESFFNPHSFVAYNETNVLVNVTPANCLNVNVNNIGEQIRKFISDNDITSSKIYINFAISGNSPDEQSAFSSLDNFNLEFNYQDITIKPYGTEINAGDSKEFIARIGTTNITNQCNWIIEPENNIKKEIISDKIKIITSFDTPPGKYFLKTSNASNQTCKIEIVVK